MKLCKIEHCLRGSWNGISIQVFIIVILNVGSQIAPADGLITLPLTILKSSTGRTLPVMLGIAFLMLVPRLVLMVRFAVIPASIVLKTQQHRMSSILAWSSFLPCTVILCRSEAMQH